MRLTRLIAGATTAGLLGLVPVAAGTPAQATDNLTTTTAIESSERAVVYGDTVYITGDVAGSDGQSAYYGTVTLYRMQAGASAWTPVATDDASGYFGFYDIKPAANTLYKVLYSGYAATNPYEDNYAPSESAPIKIGVQRKVTIRLKSAALTVLGKVAPKYKHKLVIASRKVGTSYKRFRVVRTDSRSRFSVKLPAPRRRGARLYFKLTIKGDSEYLGWTGKYYTYTYRGAARTGVQR